MEKKKFALGIFLLLAALALDTFMPFIINRFILTYPSGSMFIPFVIAIVTLIVVTILLVKGGSQILKSSHKSRSRIENVKLLMVAALLIFTVPKLLELLSYLIYELSSIIGEYVFFNSRYFLTHITAFIVFVVAMIVLLQKQSPEEIIEDEEALSQPVPYSKLTYIGSAIVSLPFLAAAILLFEELFLYSEDYILSANFISSNLYWSLTIIILLVTLFTEGLQFYKVEYKDSYGNKVGTEQVDGNIALQNEVMALAKTFFMPVLIAGFVAIIPYYIFYYTIGFFLMNGFTIALLILLILGIFGGLFVFSRKDKNKTAEFLWLFAWFFVGLLLLAIMYVFIWM